MDVAESGADLVMMKMMGYLISILEEEDKKNGKRLTVLSFLCPVVDLFCYMTIVSVINLVIQTNQMPARLIIFVFFMGGVSVLEAFVNLYRCRISTQFIYKSAQRLSEKLYEVLMKEELGKHNQKSAAQAMMMVQSDALNCVSILADGITVCSHIFTISGFTLLLIYVSRWVGIVTSLVLVACMLLYFFRYRAKIKLYGEKCRTYRIKINAQTATAYGAFREIKIDNSSEHILHRYQESSSRYALLQSEFDYRNSGIGALLQNMMVMLLFISLGIFMIRGGNLSIVLSTMLSYITALIRMVPGIYGILAGINSIEFLSKSYEAVKDNFEQYKVIKEAEAKDKRYREKDLTFQQGLTVRNLTFAYQGHKQIFDHINIDIPVGISVAVIGVSGAGKTTFLDLILGLLKPQSGSILYDDYDIVSHRDREGACKANLGKIISYIPQTIYLNGETVRNNVAFFDEEDKIDDHKVEEALKCAQIWEDVSKMPDGIRTVIGENGAVISGGQRQRIALARALYKDFEFLIMDEATAALDMETEKAVIDSIRQLKEGKTMLMVTHHMSLANECDRIYKIEDQRMVRVK